MEPQKLSDAELAECVVRLGVLQEELDECFDARADDIGQVLAHVSFLEQRHQEGERDTERLNAISVAGASTRVAYRAMENRADPPSRRYATASIPTGSNSSCTSDALTLRAAIDSATKAARPKISTALVDSVSPSTTPKEAIND